MLTYIQIGKLIIPGYGLMIALGVIVANIIAFRLLRRYKMDGNDFLIIEAYILLGAMLGAKGLYLFVSRDMIEWNRILEPEYFNSLMKGGFVFYGGAIGGFLTLLLGAKIHRIEYREYVQRFMWLIPFIHAFGRLGCFLAGCCYGREYDGIFSVVFPENSLAPAGVPLFPVQLVEALCLLVIALLACLASYKKASWHGVEIYLIGYGILRFALEYARDDAARGFVGVFSTSQWISIFLVVGVAGWMIGRKICANRIRKA